MKPSRFDRSEMATGMLPFGLDVGSLGARRRRQFARLFFQVRGGFNEPRGDAQIRGGLGHLEQHSCCLTGMEAVLCHDGYVSCQTIRLF